MKKRAVKTRTLVEWSAYILIALVPVAVLLAAFYPTPRVQQPETFWTTRSVTQTSLLTQITRPRTAAILDQLASYNRNEELITTIHAYLAHAGYTVEVFSGAQITVDFYRQLPSRGYGVIILRVHSSSTMEIGQSRVASGAPVYLLTGEPHNQLGYAYDQLMGYVRPVRIEAGTFFGIGPEFVTQRMQGKFSDTIVILAGCESVKNTNMAKALISRGASHVIGWSDSVELTHNDKAIVSLTRDLFERRLSPAKAVMSTMQEIGRDPTFQSFLVCYPTEP